MLHDLGAPALEGGNPGQIIDHLGHVERAQVAQMWRGGQRSQAAVCEGVVHEVERVGISEAGALGEHVGVLIAKLAHAEGEGLQPPCGQAPQRSFDVVGLKRANEACKLNVGEARDVG